MVTKRDGRRTPFDPSKIKKALEQAFMSVDNNLTEDSKVLIDKIVNSIESTKGNSECSVEELQDILEKKLMASSRKDVARAFITYRNERTKIREHKTVLIKNVKEKLSASNVQNQNANVDERSFGGRKGEADSELMRKIALDDCVSKMARKNHENNEIYIHDLDSYAVGMHNCYDASTKFITKNGVKRFGECTNGEIVEVIDRDGNWRRATVKKYGKQKMFDLVFTSGLTTKTVTCTRNHRWVLENGDVSDDIQIGDSLYLAPELNDTNKDTLDL